MIFKHADDRSAQIERLRELSEDTRIPEEIREKISAELKRRHAGIAGEKRSAYEIDFHFGAGKNWAVIHDLRIEHEGRVAQIDHLLINRFLEIYVVESKHYSEGFTINEREEFTRFHNNRPYGIESPHEQNKKHLFVLQTLLDSGKVELPKRLGLTLKPDLKNVIMISPSARITIPPGTEKKWNHILKADALRSWIDKEIDADSNNPLKMAGIVKLVAPETVHALAQRIVEQHTPLPFNRFEPVAHYGLSPYLSQPLPKAASTPKEIARAAPVQPAKAPVETVEESAPCCQGCGGEVAAKVVSYCRLPKNRTLFGGKILCRECQVAAAPAAKPETKPAQATSPTPGSRTHCAACDIPVDDKVAYFCRLPKNREKFGGQVLCRECQPK